MKVFITIDTVKGEGMRTMYQRAGQQDEAQTRKERGRKIMFSAKAHKQVTVFIFFSIFLE